MNDARKEFVFVIGKSAGMDQASVLKGFNALVDAQKKVEDDSTYTLVFFNEPPIKVADNKSLKDIRKYNVKTYVPKGGSALYDAIGTAVEAVGARLAAQDESERPSQVVVVIMGEDDSASTTYTKEAVKEMVELQKYTYKWDFVFFGNGGSALGITKGGELKDAADAFGMVSEYMTSLR